LSISRPETRPINNCLHSQGVRKIVGGALSPLLANLLLDDLDKELERRGHAFCRYADDCNIYVQSEAAGQRVMASVCRFLETKLKLHVNRQKSAIARVEERKFLGHRLLSGGRLGIAPKSLERAKNRIREITRRNRGIGLERMIGELNSFLSGWVTYFRHAAIKSHLVELDGWVRRKLRCMRLKQCKRVKTMAAFFVRQGVSLRHAWCTALSGKGWWRKSGTPTANQTMPANWWDSLGLVNLVRRFVSLQSR
jgi:RNA-directed DNA polymerase